MSNDMSTGVQMHGLECPECHHKFYVRLPDGDTVKEIECVDCNEEIEATYNFHDDGETIHVDVEVESING